MTIAVDFDGVIHAYTQGWQNGVIYDPPLPGALEALPRLMATQAVFILTARDPGPVAEWLAERVDFPVTYESRGLTYDYDFWNDQSTLLVTNRKLPAYVYIDDRGLRFETWEQTLAALATFGIEVLP